MSEKNVAFVLELLKQRPQKEVCCVCGVGFVNTAGLYTVYGRSHKACFKARNMDRPNINVTLWTDFDLYLLSKLKAEDEVAYNALLWQVADKVTLKYQQILTESTAIAPKKKTVST